jgi:5-methylcytosine-specific restriction endonuclease McrA
MSNQVYANNMEVSCKSAAGKSICAFPDVCFTPPQTPATPPGVPIPYPNTGMASDTTSGSTSVKISGKEVMLKNKSYFKKSMGDEAGCAPKKGVMTSKNMGKVYFKAWSMDVKAEGENVVRHLDITTHNHASDGPNTPPMPHIDRMYGPFGADKPCKAECPTEPDKDRMKEIRASSPGPNGRSKVKNAKGCFVCGRTKTFTPDLAFDADHIVPLKKISQIPGFACLPPDKQVAVANIPENLAPTCATCNRSRQDNLFSEWSGVKKKGRETSLAPWVRESLSKTTDDAMHNIKLMISGHQC